MFAQEILSSYLESTPHSYLSEEETFLININLSVRIYDEFLEIYSHTYRSFSKLIRSEFIKEDYMVEGNLLRLLINDILSTEEYTLEGIANEMRTPVDVIIEIASGVNVNPSLQVSAKIFRLHSQVRKDLYNQIVKKFFASSAA